MFQSSPTNLIPRWDPETRELKVGDLLVKKFRTSATAQVALLEAFQRENWKKPIRNPFRYKRGDRDPQDRLHDALINLNRRQVNKLLLFERNGGGYLICSLIEPPNPPPVEDYAPS